MSIHTPTITATPSFPLSHSLADEKFKAVVLSGCSAIFLVAFDKCGGGTFFGGRHDEEATAFDLICGQDPVSGVL